MRGSGENREKFIDKLGRKYLSMHAMAMAKPAVSQFLNVQNPKMYC